MNRIRTEEDAKEFYAKAEACAEYKSLSGMVMSAICFIEMAATHFANGRPDLAEDMLEEARIEMGAVNWTSGQWGPKSTLSDYPRNYVLHVVSAAHTPEAAS